MTTKREKLLAGLEVCRNNPEWDQRFYILSTHDFISTLDLFKCGKNFSTNFLRIRNERIFKIN